MNLKMSPETALLEESFDRKTGKQLEAMVFGESTTGTNEDIERLNKMTFIQLKGAVNFMNQALFDVPSEGDENIITKDFFLGFLKKCAENPNTLKVGMSKVETVISELVTQSIATRSAEEREAINKRIEFLKKRLRVFKAFEHSLKDSLSKTDEKMLSNICDMMSQVQESEPIKTDFSVSLIESLEKSLTKSGVEVRKLQFVTTLVEGDDKITWPDYFGADAFINYDLVIDGVEKKGRILIDGTANPTKENGDKKPGISGFLSPKFVIPFSSLHNKDDVETLARNTAEHISANIVPMM
jgi:hypothetical protein